MADDPAMMSSGLQAKSNDFFQGIAEARPAVGQMKVDWQLTDSKIESDREREVTWQRH
jgi:hypothetical protein